MELRRPQFICLLYPRYARMYESWGCVTLSYSAPGRALYMAGQEAELVTIAARLAALTTELCVGESPVMVHCLGLNSVSIYNHVREVNIVLTNVCFISIYRPCHRALTSPE